MGCRRRGGRARRCSVGVSALLGSGTRVIARLARSAGPSRGGAGCASTSTGSATPATSGRSIRTAHALVDGHRRARARTAPIPTAPKAVRASMGSIFAQPLARGAALERARRRPACALDARAGSRPRRGDRRLEPPLDALSSAPSARASRPSVLEAADASARSRSPRGGAESLNVAAAAAIALYESEIGSARDG